MTEATLVCNIQESTYHCEKGHKLKVFGTWSSLSISDGYRQWTYNYCPFCFGEWAEQQWPFVKQNANP